MTFDDLQAAAHRAKVLSESIESLRALEVQRLEIRDRSSGSLSLSHHGLAEKILRTGISTTITEYEQVLAAILDPPCAHCAERQCHCAELHRHD